MSTGRERNNRQPVQQEKSGCHIEKHHCKHSLPGKKVRQTEGQGEEKEEMTGKGEGCFQLWSLD